MSRQKSGRLDIPRYDCIRRLSREGRTHFVGIGGVSMYSLASLALLSGRLVSGSDKERSERTDRLSALGAEIHIGHSRENVDGASLVVYSHAIGQDNPELAAAREKNIVTVNRAEYMGAEMTGYTGRIGVSGSHGKSTTVAMLDAIFCSAGADPTVLSGGGLNTADSFRYGSKGTLIYEACEYRDSFLRFLPSVAVALNLELDHIDYFPDISALRASFLQALCRADDFVVVNGDDENLRLIMPKITRRCVSFGRSRENLYRYDITSYEEGNFAFDLYKFGSKIGSLALKIPGVFNLHNATAAAVTALELGIDIDVIRDALATFRGIPRRLEYLGEIYGRPIYYDYAHHPTEIRASITALRGLTHMGITVLFRPHTFSRTEGLWDELCSALSLADHTVVCDIFAAREEPIIGITAENLAGAIGKGAVYCPDALCVEYILKNTKGAIVLMGAGDLSEIKNHLTR